MQLKQLLSNTAVETIIGPDAVEVAAITCDSRKVLSGSAFFALPGVKFDGFEYIPQAIDSGAVVVVCQHLPQNCPAEVTFVCVTNVRRTMAEMAAEFNNHPSRGVKVIGITGTNGKTSISYLLEAVCRRAGYRPAVFGTVEYRFEDHRHEAPNTTPESVALLGMMADFRALGADLFILEVSSHALDQHRVDGIEFDVAVFTNLTRDHLDYHSDLDDYFGSKKRLFTELLGQGKGLINGDDEYGQKLLALNRNWISYGESESSAISPAGVDVCRDGIHGQFNCGDKVIKIESSMIGHFNVSNLLAAVAAADSLAIDATVIAAGITAAPQVPGRVEKILNPCDVLALVDYAHTGDALEQVLSTLQRLDHRRLITVVGCGGDRDAGKRPIMARVALRHSDLVVFTSDNPRTEDPLVILAQLRQAAIAIGSVELSAYEAVSQKNGFVVIEPRRDAIELAAQSACAGDLLLVAGKGHEDYQIIGREKIHFDDREELKRILTLNHNESRRSADV